MNVLANKYSFHPLMKEKIPVATSPGTVSGKITVAKILNLPAPSTLAASSQGDWDRIEESLHHPCTEWNRKRTVSCYQTDLCIQKLQIPHNYI